MAFVVVTHLGPGRESALPGIHATDAIIPVQPASDSQRIERNHGYMLPFDAILSVEKAAR